MTNAELPWISSAEVFERVGIGEAIHAVQRELKAGLVPANDLRRSIRNVDHGQLLMMPSQSPEFVGIKIASVAPGNPALGRERIQGVYLLMDAATLSPIALFDGPALTALRTPAISAAVADHLAAARVDHLVASGPDPWREGISRPCAPSGRSIGLPLSPETKVAHLHSHPEPRRVS
jgi:ornithine cyclodeaminase